MNASLRKELGSFQEEFFHDSKIPSDHVIALLDKIKESLSLQDIYVCECSASKYHFLYHMSQAGKPKNHAF